MPSYDGPRIRVYDAGGMKVETIELSTHLQCSQHAVETSNRMFVVSFLPSLTDISQVVELSADGLMLRACGMNLLDRPFNLDLDQDGDISDGLLQSNCTSG